MVKGPANGGISKRIPRMLVPDTCRLVEGGTMVTINPSENVLIGANAICDYVGIRPSSLHNWVDGYGFPAIKRPDGKWMSTVTAIDQWLFLAAEIESRNRREDNPHRVLIDNVQYHHKMKGQQDEYEQERQRRMARQRHGFRHAGNKE